MTPISNAQHPAFASYYENPPRTAGEARAFVAARNRENRERAAAKDREHAAFRERLAAEQRQAENHIPSRAGRTHSAPAARVQDTGSVSARFKATSFWDARQRAHIEGDRA